MVEPALAPEYTEAKLNEMIVSGRIMDAYEALYADDVVIQENADPPCQGKDANRERQYKFFGLVKEVLSVSLVSGAVAGNRAFSEWDYDILFNDGFRYRLVEVAVREWSGGKVVRERFYWNMKHYPYEVYPRRLLKGLAGRSGLLRRIPTSGRSIARRVRSATSAPSDSRETRTPVEIGPLHDAFHWLNLFISIGGTSFAV